MAATLFAGRAPRLWLRLEQHADKPIYAQLPAGTADGYIVNANLVEQSPAACASFLGDRGKPFILDPMSYRFEGKQYVAIAAGSALLVFSAE